jgi:hypothetical protein
MNNLTYNPNVNIPYNNNYNNTNNINMDFDESGGNFNNNINRNSNYNANYNMENMKQMRPPQQEQQYYQPIMQPEPQYQQQPMYPQMQPIKQKFKNKSSKINTIDKFEDTSSSKLDWILLIKKLIIYTALFLVMSHVKMNELICKFIPFIGDNEILCMTTKGILLAIIIIVIQIILK